MSKIIYIKNSYWKILYFICIISIINLILLSSSPINAALSDIAYMNLLITAISLLFAIIDYRRWKSNYETIVDAVKNHENIDSCLPVSCQSFEISLLKNIIELKNAEKEHELEKIKEGLNEVNDYITKWIHEIKIPIAVCELIIDKIDDYSDEEYISKISEELRIEIERIKFLINQVLYISRASNYSEDLQINEISTDKVIKEVIKRNTSFFIAKNISLVLGNINFNVMTDEKWILYIIDQIINNACKYVDKHGEIQIYGEEDERFAKLFIKDNGIGIMEKDLRRIFDKGFTGGNGRNLSKSTGMGLYLSKKICNKLNHDLYVNSKEGEGAEFTICFYKISDYFNVT